MSQVDDTTAQKRPAEHGAARPNKPTRKKVKRKHMDPNVLSVRSTIQQCCATNDLGTAMATYERAKQNGTRLEAQTFYNLLNLCDGLGDRKLHVGTPKRVEATVDDETKSSKEETISLNERKDYAFRIKAHMDELQLPLVETAYTALVKLSCRTGALEHALDLIQQAEGTEQCRPKLRLYAPLLQAYAARGELPAALQIWRRLSQRELHVTEQEYTALIQCATKVGDAIVMERLLSDLAEDVLVPSKDACQAIVEWFESAAAVVGDDESSTEKQTSSSTATILDQIKFPGGGHAANMGPVQCSSSWIVSDACSVDTSSGLFQSGCLNGESLQPVALSQPALEEMRTMNETIVLSGKLDQDKSQHQGGRKGPKRQLKKEWLQERQRHWQNLQSFLAKRGPLDVVIDGANVGYYEQNFAGAPKHVEYRQIEWMVEHFLRLNKSIVVFLHARHLSPKLMPRQAEPLVRSWQQRGILYQTPHGMNDDWFWMHAALYSGTGRTCLVVSNDEMRDHHFQMLAPRSFLRWKERSQVRFTFGAWEKDDSRPGNRMRQRVELTYPDPYSRRIQRVRDGLVIPMPKQGDANRFLDGAHVADEAEPTEERYVCIRPSSN